MNFKCEKWYDIFGRVARTGIDEKHDLLMTSSGVHYQLHAFKVGGPEEPKVAIMFDHTWIMQEKKSEVAQNSEEKYWARLEQEVVDRTREIREYYALIQTIYDTTLIGMSVFEPVRNDRGIITDFKITMANRKIERTTGRNDLKGKLYEELFPVIKHMGLFDLMVKTIETGEHGQMEYHCRYEGIDRWYSTMFVKAEDLLVSTNLDITERIKAEDERFRNYLLLQQSEALAQTGSWDFDLLTGSFTWSDGMYKLFDLQQGTEVKPEIYLEYATSNSRATAERIVAHLRTGDQEFEEKMEIAASGRIKIIRLKATVVRTSTGKPGRVLGVDMDITATLEAERRLQQMETQQQQEIFQATLSAQEEERRRISESLHNGVAQLLYATQLSLNLLNIELARKNPGKFNECKTYTISLLTDSIKQTRRISHKLMPAILTGFGLAAAIKDICNQLQYGLRIDYQVSLREIKLSSSIELAVFRIVQELMLNVVKHANATRAEVEVTADQRQIAILVRDNGKGITISKHDKPGIGLPAIRNKVGLLKGSINIQSIPNKGTTVEIVLPHQVNLNSHVYSKHTIG